MAPKFTGGVSHRPTNVVSVYAVETTDLRKSYGDIKALDGLNLQMPQGSVLGVLGPNGAGKTTAVKVLTTLTLPDGGQAFVDGIDVVAEPDKVRARIGLTGQYAAVEERLTGRENLEYIARLFHMPKREAKGRAAGLLERFDLVEAADRVAIGYSGGMKRRLDIAMSLIARPSVLFLDEPTTGLDPRSRQAMWTLIEELVAEGTTTFLTTQYLDEAEALADSIIVIDHGKVIASGTADELKDQIGGDRLVITLAPGTDRGLAAEAMAAIASAAIDSVTTADTLLVPIRTGGGAVPQAVRALDDAGCDIANIELRRPSLDDVFLALTGHAAENYEEKPSA